MKNRKFILNEQFIDQLGKDEYKLEVQPRFDFAQKLEQKLLEQYDHVTTQASSVSGIERIRHSFMITINSMNTLQKVSAAGFIVLALGILSYGLMNKTSFVEAFEGFPQKVRSMFVPQVDKDGKITFSTSTFDGSSTAGDTIHLSLGTSTEMGAVKVEELVKQGLVEVVLDEVIEGKKVIGLRYADGDRELFIDGQMAGYSSFMPGVKLSDTTEMVRKAMRMSAQRAIATEKLNGHLENTYQVQKYSSLESLIKDVKLEIIKEFPSNDPNHRFAAVKFPNGTKALVTQMMSTLYTPTSTGTKIPTLSFEAYLEDQFDITTGLMQAF